MKQNKKNKLKERKTDRTTDPLKILPLVDRGCVSFDLAWDSSYWSFFYFALLFFCDLCFSTHSTVVVVVVRGFGWVFVVVVVVVCLLLFF